MTDESGRESSPPRPTKTAASSWIDREYSHLVGGRILRLIVSGDATDPDTAFGFDIATKSGIVRAWVLRDPEGNGPGFLHIEHRK